MLRRLAKRIQMLAEEIAYANAELDAILTDHAPNLPAVNGVGPEAAGQILTTAGENIDRLTSESSLARLRGVAPIPASSGNTSRHRLHRGGDRDANSTIHLIVVNRPLARTHQALCRAPNPGGQDQKRHHPLPQTRRRPRALSSTPHRPTTAKCHPDLTAGQRDAVIVYNLDRLHRRPVELEEFVALCERAGVHHVATVTADIDLGNDDGLFMARIFAAFAAKESGRKSARVRRKLLQNAERGLPHGSVRPFGYGDDKIMLRPDEAAVVREMVDRYLAGESLRALTIWLNDTEVAPAIATSWQTSAVRQIISSGRIAGLREHRGEVIGPALWPAIIKRNGTGCWPAWRRGPSPRRGQREPICCRGCCAVGAVATGSSPRRATSIRTTGYAATSA